MKLMGVQLKVGEGGLCDIGTSGNRLQFDCPPVGCFHKWSKRPYVPVIGVIPINLCECGLVGIRGMKWPRRGDMGWEDYSTGDVFPDEMYPGACSSVLDKK